MVGKPERKVNFNEGNETMNFSGSRWKLSVGVAVLGSALVSGLLAGVVSGSPAIAEQAEKDEVLAAVQAFFDGLAEGPEALNATLLDEGSVTRLRERGGAVEWNILTFAEMSASQADNDARMLERMWDATVLVHGPLAQVWTPYDFYVNGDFSHCGVDSFTLIKTTQGWRVSSVAYTVEPSDCEPSPLGPPRR